jgi:RNA polymerase sigma-70 factor (ECF subfamily)
VARYAFWRGQRERSAGEAARSPQPTAKDGPRDSLLAADALGHADALFNLACYLTANASEAEDLVQETYARALSSGALFRGGNVKAWLFQILRNAHIDLYRKAKVHALATELEVWEGGAEGGGGPSELSTNQMRALVASDVDEALRSLTPDARTTILLDIEGLREGEMAQVLGCAAGTVKSRLARARGLLRLKLKDYAR